MKVTKKQIEQHLPPDKEGFTFRVVNVSPLVHRVDLVHNYPYDYACGKDVWTVFCFIKGDKVHQPKNSKDMRAKHLCDLVDLPKQTGYTTIIPKTTSLLHLL